MNETPSDLKFLASHEWIRLGDDNIVVVGISDHAQEQLGCFRRTSKYWR